MVTAIGTFTSLLVVFFGLALLVPIINAMFEVDTNSAEFDTLTQISQNKSGLQIAGNLFVMFFWTFGLPIIFNIIFVPFRILGLIALYYIIFPTK